MKYNFELELVNNNSLLLILQQVCPNSVVLEFGPANGRLTKYLKEELGCSVYLAELDEKAGKEALQYGVDLVVGDVENYQWFKKYQNVKFDYIIFADVLEHLRNPKDILAKSKLLLKESGSVLLSVPNLAHNSVLIDLMKNQFQYRSVGLLDNTHIHFFTINSLEQMIKDCDLHPCKRMATYSEVGKNEIKNSTKDIPLIDESYWNSREYGEIYQFVYEVKKGKEYIDEEINILKPVLNHFYIQAYADFGTGMNESLSVKKFIDIKREKQSYEFMIDDECITFRIDPLNSSCFIKIISSVLLGNDFNVNISFDMTNAERKYEDYYVFTTDDPELLINLEPYKDIKNKKIKIEYEIINFGKKDINTTLNIFNILEKELDEKSKLIDELKSENFKIMSELEKSKSENTDSSKKRNRFF